MDIFSLRGKVAVVTGGASHLGAAISEGLAEAGADVVVASRNQEKCGRVAEELAKKSPVRTMGLALDMRSMAGVQDCFLQIDRQMGAIDVLVNNAAFAKAGTTMETVTEADWLEAIEGTVNGVFRCIQAVLPYMGRGKPGAIINISSMYGMVSPDPRIYGDSGYDNPAGYGAGKAAVIQLTRYAACQLAPKGIRVNAVSPGAFPSPVVQKDKRFLAELQRKVPLGRIGEPSDLKGVIVFLASDASSYITGQNIVVDGGWTAW